MRKVVVTGSAGKTGPFVVDELQRHGYETLGVDIAEQISSSALGTIRALRADLRSLSEAIEAFEGADGIVHLANVSLPGMRTASATFVENVAINHNVFRAAELLKIDRIVWLSSAAVAEDLFTGETVMRLPIDESVEWSARSAYSLSKVVTEFIAGFCSSRAASVVGLRPPLIEDPKDYAHYGRYHGDIAARKWHMWSYIDARDVARACRLALEARPLGVTNMFIAARDTVMDCPVEVLFRARYPGADPPEALIAHGSFFSSRLAAERIGFQPLYSWRDGCDAK